MSEGIGKKIRTARERLHMTQDELAKLTGYTTRSAINKIELGYRDIPRKKLDLFASALDIPVDYLLGYENSPVLQMMIKQNQDTPQNRLCEKVRTLEDEECEQVSDYVDYVVSKRE